MRLIQSQEQNRPRVLTLSIIKQRAVSRDLVATDTEPTATAAAGGATAAVSGKGSGSGSGGGGGGSELFGLSILYLDGLRLSSVGDALDPFQSLTNLYLQRNSLSRISGLNRQPLLRFLALFENQIETVENLSHCDNLLFLDLSKNKIKTLNVGKCKRSLTTTLSV